MQQLDPTRAAALQKIHAQARAAMTAGIVSIVFFGFIFGPGALIRAGVVRSAVAQHNLGHQYLDQAKTATTLGIVGLSLWSVGLLLYLVV